MSGTEIINGNTGLPAGPITSLPPWMNSLAVAMGEVEGRPCLPASMMPNETQRASIVSRIEALDRELSPAAPRDVAMVVGEMFAVYPSSLSVEAQKFKIAGYVTDLGGLPLWAVKGAASKWRRGEVKGDVRFAPASGEWRRLAEAQTLEHRAQIAKLSRVLSAKAISTERPSAEARASVAAKVGDILQSLSSKETRA